MPGSEHHDRRPTAPVPEAGRRVVDAEDVERVERFDRIAPVGRRPDCAMFGEDVAPTTGLQAGQAIEHDGGAAVAQLGAIYWGAHW